MKKAVLATAFLFLSAVFHSSAAETAPEARMLQKITQTQKLFEGLSNDRLLPINRAPKAGPRECEQCQNDCLDFLPDIAKVNQCMAWCEATYSPC